MSEELERLAQEAAAALVLAALPPLREPDDVTVDDFMAAAEKDGYELSSRKQAAYFLRQAGYENVVVWDSERQTKINVYRKQMKNALNGD